MKKLIFLLPIFLTASEDFISHYDYGKMLFESPRGVSCVQCHGINAEGKTIVEYETKKGMKHIDGPDIRRVSLKNMIKSLNKNHAIMPRYYLTEHEVKAIFDYLQKRNSRYLFNLEM
jgi:mono/diheme cytochrome c family protein